VLALLVEQEPQADEGVEVPGIGGQGLAQRVDGALAGQGAIHERDAGQVPEASRVAASVVGQPGLLDRGLGEVDPELTAKRGVAPALERRGVAAAQLVGRAEVREGVVDRRGRSGSRRPRVRNAEPGPRIGS
jgi:hypothetical protein